ncbi:nucleotide modification associated domain-containing protein [Blattabacterium cuenoti]|uniref:nucleotide modification associated domain-containing protein n=1 Tax=Blattabacterium cuenoti TaxID=1653831 RepID=UPI00163D1CDC|nr:nucleotide modification associated domain-containing protein [Blattabacterium cuenoti]
MNNISIHVVINNCKKLFKTKLKNYDMSWKYIDNYSIIDLIIAKTIRIINIQKKGFQIVKEETIENTYMDVINYIIIIMIKLNINDNDKISYHDIIYIYTQKLEKICNIIEHKSQFEYVSLNQMLKNLLYLKNNKNKILSHELEEMAFKILYITILLYLIFKSMNINEEKNYYCKLENEL